MIYLVLYDTRGQCQRVATANSRESANAFLQVGFAEVDKAEYDRCAALAPTAQMSDLNNVQIAQDLLNRINDSAAQVLNIESDSNVLERLILVQRDKLRSITQRLLDGLITDTVWYRQMVDAINAAHVAASALAVGGFENLSSDEVTLIERANEIQSQYVTRFRRDIGSLSAAQALARAGLYAGANTSRYWTAFSRAKGVPQLPAMPGVRTTCGSNCKCNWNIVKLDGEGNFNCQWKLSAVESCQECLQRQRIFNPLKIRNGIVQSFNPSGIYV